MSALVRRMGGARATASLSASIVCILVLVVVVPLLVIWPFGRTHTPRVEVHDEAGVLQADGTKRAMEQIRFRQDVRLVVLTLDADYDANFNSEVLAYARANAPDWISTKNPNYWADGLIILAVSPSGRWVGCYFGEDVKVSEADQQEIQDVAKSSFRKWLWAPGLEQMANRTADMIGRPVTSTTAATTLSIVSAAVGLAWLSLMVWAATSARTLYRKARGHYGQVTADYQATELNARLIPSDDAHGGQVLARFAWFKDRYAQVTRLFERYGEPRAAQWCEIGRRARAKELLERASTLDSLDDAISNAAALLSMGQGWEESWANEQGPVQEDLASLMDLCAKVDVEGDITTVAEREWVRSQRDRLARMTELLRARTLTPRDALDELDAISAQVRSRADDLAKRALEASSYSKDRLRRYENGGGWFGSPNTAYVGAWTMGGHSSSYDPAATIRINPSSPGVGASGVSWAGAGSASHFSAPVSDLVTGYSSAASWSPSSGGSGGSGGAGFSGGGFSGGGFSGAGSSSHF